MIDEAVMRAARHVTCHAKLSAAFDRLGVQGKAAQGIEEEIAVELRHGEVSSGGEAMSQAWLKPPCLRVGAHKSTHLKALMKM
ncbi:hypothetical protein [Pantoea sp. 18069]|uniref:hypothetical protein n=1 Tax=Pantoea sp. 18069 TaxID=2681415 RepID=UPI001F2F461E|nr:hypothetical protein [Pantoea sp. 18069]